MRVTYEQIAEKAGVSKMSVTQAFRKSPHVSEKTRQRILKIAEELGYERDPLLDMHMRNVRHRHHTPLTANVAFLCDCDLDAHHADGHYANEFVSRLYNGAREAAKEFGFDLDHIEVTPGTNAKGLNNLLQARGIAGILLPPLAYYPDPLPLNWELYSGVEVGLGEKNQAIYHRVFDHCRFAMETVLKEVEHCGYQRIGLMLENMDLRFCHEVYLSEYLLWQHHHPERKAIPPLTGEQIPLAAFKDWFHQHRPDAVIGIRDLALRHLKAMNIPVPEKMGYANLFVTEKLSHTSGMVPRIEELGRMAVESLVRQMTLNLRGVPEFPRLHQIRGIWNESETTVSKER